MQHYTHDYTLPSLAESLLQTAQAALRMEKYDEVSRLLADARQTLGQYLSQDNMVPDNEVYGYYKASDVEEEIERLKANK